MSWACLIFSILSTWAHADSGWTGELGFSVGDHVPEESILNPSNRYFEVPAWDSLLDLRAEYKIMTEHQKFVLRPRWTGTTQTINYSDTLDTRQRALGSWDLTDAYYELTVLDDLQFTAGLLVEGWGPAEFVNPSNPFFHLKPQSKSFFFKEKGHALVKALWNPTAKTAISVISEPVSNQERSFRVGEDFRPEWAARAEWQSEDANELIGLVGGQEFGGVQFTGEYLQLRHEKSGFSLYWEARHSKEAQRFEIVPHGSFNELVLQNLPGTQTYSVSGLRWEGRADVRFEWIHYDLGYSEAEWDRLIQSVTTLSPYIVSNAQKFSQPGLEFLTKNWWSISVRTPDLGPWKDWQWTNRLLLSMGDKVAADTRAGLFQTDLEMPAFKAWTFYAEAQIFYGQKNTELTLNSEQNYYLGARWAW